MNIIFRSLGFSKVSPALFSCLVGSITMLLFSRAFAAEPIPTLNLKSAFPGLKFSRPLWLEEAPDGSRRFFVIEQTGKILILPQDRNGNETKTFLDITDRKPLRDNEEGLLGFAFHPQFKSNRKFYIFYSQQMPKRSVISEFQASAQDPDKADPASERVLLEIPRPYWNHDGGTIIFGPDGYLYISVGDGGKMNDPHNLGQSLNFWQGKILRIDVNSRTGHLQYGIPNDNPFIGKDSDGFRAEIWAYGLRNPWRVSFDRETGELWAGDVGQDKWEEVDLIVKGGNYGWSVREGFHPFKDMPPNGDTIDPIIEYAHTPVLAKESKFPDHTLGLSITGGYVYRGKKLPQLRGVYLYADYVSGTVWGLRAENGKLTANGVVVKGNPARPIVSFGQDLDGEVYVLTFDTRIYEFVEPAKEASK